MKMSNQWHRSVNYMERMCVRKINSYNARMRYAKDKTRLKWERDIFRDILLNIKISKKTYLKSIPENRKDTAFFDEVFYI